MPTEELVECACCGNLVPASELELRYVPVKRSHRRSCQTCMEKYVTYAPGEWEAVGDVNVPEEIA